MRKKKEKKSQWTIEYVWISFDFNRLKSLGTFVCSVPRNAILYFFSNKEPILSNIQNDFLSFSREIKYTHTHTQTVIYVYWINSFFDNIESNDTSNTW